MAGVAACFGGGGALAVAAVCLLVAVCVTASVRRPTRNLLTTLFVEMAVTSTEGAAATAEAAAAVAAVNPTLSAAQRKARIEV
jgi:hypothetical protein